MVSCPLCQSDSKLFSIFKGRKYFCCSFCCSIFADPDSFISSIDEKSRYLEHNNDVFDEGYRKFVTPIVDAVVKTSSTINTFLNLFAVLLTIKAFFRLF